MRADPHQPDGAAAEFDPFYVEHADSVTRQLILLTGDVAEAEHAAQEAFEQAWLHWSTVRSCASPGAWIRTVARRLAVSRWRRRQNAAAAWLRRATPAASVEIDGESMVLMEARKALPVAQRVAIVLFHLADLPVAQIAEETGASVAAEAAPGPRPRGARGVAGGDPAGDLRSRPTGGGRAGVIDDLTTTVHAAGERLPAPSRSATEVRARAESRRRAHRIVGGVTTCVLAAAVIVGSSLLTAPAPTDQGSVAAPPSAPAIGPLLPQFYELMVARDQNVVVILETTGVSDRPTWRMEQAIEAAVPSQQGRCPGSPGPCLSEYASESAQHALFDLAADPVLPDAQLGRYGDQRTGSWHRTDAGVPTLTECRPAPQSLAAGTAVAASWVAEPDLYLNEFVLRYDTVAAASAAVALIRQTADACPNYALASLEGPDESWFPVPGWPVDEYMERAGARTN